MPKHLLHLPPSHLSCPLILSHSHLVLPLLLLQSIHHGFCTLYLCIKQHMMHHTLFLPLFSIHLPLMLHPVHLPLTIHLHQTFHLNSPFSYTKCLPLLQRNTLLFVNRKEVIPCPPSWRSQCQSIPEVQDCMQELCHKH